jgi:plasmid maintenance system antidote protein VapI
MNTPTPLFDRNDPSVRFVSKSLHIGSRLLDTMAERELNDTELAKQLGITHTTLRHYIGGNHDFTLREIAAIESLFNEDFIKILH